jgi:hypothetical protein
MTAARRAAIALAIAVAAPAAAQQAAPPLPEDPRAPRFAEVERGFHAGFEAGPMLLFRTPVSDRSKFRFAGTGGGRATGLLVAVHAGYGFSDRLSGSLLLLGADAQAGPSYGAFGLAGGGADVRYAVFTGKDRYAVERLRGFLHARGAWVATRPSGLLGTSDLLLAGGPGLEYDTRLRHFTVGLAADLLWLARAGAPGVSIAPSVRYTF